MYLSPSHIRIKDEDKMVQEIYEWEGLSKWKKRGFYGK